MELAYRIWPHDPQQLNELALLYIWARQYDRAVPLLERSREIAGFVPRTWVNLAYTYIGVGRHADALDAADSAARLGSNQAEAFALRAQAYEGMGRHADAAAAWTAAVRDPRGRAWTYWTMRARALARLDDQHAALAAADTASTLAPERDAPIVANVRAAIAHGCYAGRPLNGPDAARASNPSAARARSYPADDCRDPLDDWAIVTTVNALPRPAGATARGPVSVRTRAGAGARYASHATVSARTRTPGGPG
jgi:tetratricopeptide (TPR) repeat protein